MAAVRIESRGPRTRLAHAFTLIELLVVVAIIALLIGILLPTLAQARKMAVTAKDLANIRSFQLAQELYAQDHKGELVDAGLPHGGVGNEPGSWVTTLQPYYDLPLVRKSPADQSPHWPADEEFGAGSGVTGGVPVPGSNPPVYRQTSYGINNYLTSYAPLRPWRKIDLIPRPAETVQFLLIAEEGQYAGSDHPHVESWHLPGLEDHAPTLAVRQVQIDSMGGPEAAWDSKSNYGFLDGHAATLEFKAVYTDLTRNQFDPEAGRHAPAASAAH